MHIGQMPGVKLVSLQVIPELQEPWPAPDGSLEIGAMVTFARLSENETAWKYIPVLPAMACSMGGPQIRNMATIDGNQCNGAPSPNPKALSAALGLHRNGQPMINSITAEKERYNQVLPLVLEYKPK